MEPTHHVKMMSCWIENAKAVTQLATAALVLPTFFLRDILGVAKESALMPHLNPWLIGAWVCFGLSIVGGLFYQVTATRIIGDDLSGTQSARLFPHFQFRLMLLCFVLGLTLFMFGVTLT